MIIIICQVLKIDIYMIYYFYVYYNTVLFLPICCCISEESLTKQHFELLKTSLHGADNNSQRWHFPCWAKRLAQTFSQLRLRALINLFCLLLHFTTKTKKVFLHFSHNYRVLSKIPFGHSRWFQQSFKLSFKGHFYVNVPSSLIQICLNAKPKKQTNKKFHLSPSLSLRSRSVFVCAAQPNKQMS